MSRGFCWPNSCHEMSVQHLLYAVEAAQKGHHEDVERHLRHSRNYAEGHAKTLRARGQHQDAEGYLKEHSTHVTATRTILENAVKNKPSTQKSENEAPTLSKGVLPATSSVAPASQVVSSEKKVSTPSEDPRYDYAPFHRLSPEQQTKAHQMFGGKDMPKYQYAVRPGTRELVHGVRSPLPAGMIPKMSQTYQKPAQEHTPGTSVRIEAPGKSYHGRFGIVHSAHPYFPGKIPVQVGHHESMKVYVEPSEVKPSRPISKIEKAMVTLYSIQKAMRK